MHAHMRTACRLAKDSLVDRCPYILLLRCIFELRAIGASISPDGGATKAARGFTPLHAACRAKSVSAVRLLLEQGAYHTLPNADGMTPAHYACDGAFCPAQLDILRALFSAGASSFVVTKAGQNLLHQAARAGNVPLLEFLTANPKILSIGIGMKDRWSRTPIEWAIINGHFDAFVFLFAPVTAAARKTKVPKHNTSTHLPFETPLHVAARTTTDDHRFVKHIIGTFNARETLATLDGDGRSVLHSCIDAIAVKRATAEHGDELDDKHYVTLGYVLASCKASGTLTLLCDETGRDVLPILEYADAVGCSVAKALISDELGSIKVHGAVLKRKRYTNASGERLMLPSGRRVRASGKQKREILKAKRAAKRSEEEVAEAARIINDKVHELKVQRRERMRNDTVESDNTRKKNKGADNASKHLGNGIKALSLKLSETRKNSKKSKKSDMKDVAAWKVHLDSVVDFFEAWRHLYASQSDIFTPEAFMLIQTCVQSGPLQNSKPAYFKKLGSEVGPRVALHARDFLKTVTSVLGSNVFSEKQLKAVAKWMSAADACCAQ